MTIMAKVNHEKQRQRPFGWLHLTKSPKTTFALRFACPHLCIASGRHRWSAPS